MSQESGGNGLEREIAALDARTQQLEVLERELRATLDSIGDAVISTDAEARVRRMNPVAEELTGWSQEEASGRPLEEVFRIVSEESRQPVVDPVSQVLREGVIVGLANPTLLLTRDGREIPIAHAAAPIRDDRDRVGGVVLVFRDQTFERRARREIALARQFVADVLDATDQALIVLDAELRVVRANRAFYGLFRSSPEETEGRLFYELQEGSWDIPALRQLLEKMLSEHKQIGEFTVERFFGRLGTRTMTISARRAESEGSPLAIVASIRDDTANLRRERSLQALAMVSTAIAETRELEPLLERLLEAARHAIPGAAKGTILLRDEVGDLSIFATSGYSDPAVRKLKFPDGRGYAARALAVREPVLIEDARSDEAIRYDGDLEEVRAIRSALAVPLLRDGHPIGVLALDADRSGAFTREDLEVLASFASTAALVIERRRLIEQTERRLRELEAVAAVGAALRTAAGRAEMLPIILDQFLELFGASGGVVAWKDPLNAETVIEAASGVWHTWTGLRLAGGEGICGHVIQSGQMLVSEDVRTDPRLVYPELLGGLHATACVPLLAQDQAVGAIWLGREHPFTREELTLLQATSELAGNALRRASLHESTARQARQLLALQEIDRAISSTAGVEIILDTVCRQAMIELAADAAGVLLLDPTSLQLEPWAAAGFRTPGYESHVLRLGEELPGQVARERRALVLVDPRAPLGRSIRADVAQAEGFTVYAAAPLVIKGTVKGVLELFWRHAPKLDRDWRLFFDRLALQCAIGVESARLFEDLQRSNMDLMLAYDATIEGWARALELRDKETEGHTRRVTDATVELARAAGMTPAELVHVRRGAILHDIGKMAIPDEILLKPGPLTEEEWAIMRQHPQVAHDLLSPISFLRPALEIPFCHHEKWDGSGYPRGLKGEAIPFAARLFAVVDVWDALRSRRPYRDPWPKEKVLDYLRDESGRHFDPRAVELFIDLRSKRPSGALRL